MNERDLGKCGFCCACCPTYIQGSCKGCMEEHTAGDCYTRDCVLKQGIPCCGACGQFPCKTILTQPRTTVLDKDWLRWKKAGSTSAPPAFQPPEDGGPMVQETTPSHL